MYYTNVVDDGLGGLLSKVTGRAGVPPRQSRFAQIVRRAAAKRAAARPTPFKRIFERARTVVPAPTGPLPTEAAMPTAPGAVPETMTASFAPVAPMDEGLMVEEGAEEAVEAVEESGAVAEAAPADFKRFLPLALGALALFMLSSRR